MSRRPTPSILKLIQGNEHPERLKDDRPKVDGLPGVPPGATLNDEERAMFEWLLETVAVPGVHGVGDGAAFVGVAKLWVQVCQCERKCAEFGLVMRNPTTSKPELQPYARAVRDLRKELRQALAEIGGTPTGRVRISGPRGTSTPGEATSWDDIS